MIKVYDMSSGNLDLINDEYDDEVLYSGYQPEVQDFVALRLQVVEVSSKPVPQSAQMPGELADIDCESFISSQEEK